MTFTHKLWHLLAWCFCISSIKGTVQLVCCFFLERGGICFLWQHRLLYHLVTSSKLWCSPVQRAWAAAALPGGKEYKVEITPLLAHTGISVLTAGTTTKGIDWPLNLGPSYVKPLQLDWFTDAAGTATRGSWSISCHIQDDCHKNTIGEKSVRWVRGHMALPRQTHPRFRSTKFKFYLSKLCIFYADNYTVQISVPFSDKPSSVGEKEGRKFQSLGKVSWTQTHSVAPLYNCL